MSASTEEDTQSGGPAEHGCYVYGILPADVELAAEVKGVGDTPGQVRLVYSGELAALVSDVTLPGSLGSPDDLRAHKEILDATATAAPVLPLRFGAVLPGEDAVIAELLEPHHGEFTAALEQLDGLAQYVVKGRYDEGSVLTEVVGENEEAARLREEIRGADADATREQRIRLGEIVHDAIDAKREQDTRQAQGAVQELAEATAAREPSHELDAVNLAVLLDLDKEDDLMAAVGELGQRWQGRVELRVLGPMAAYDFVTAGQAEG